MTSCFCYFWKEKVNTCCSEELSETLLANGTIDLFNAVLS